MKKIGYLNIGKILTLAAVVAGSVVPQTSYSAGKKTGPVLFEIGKQKFTYDDLNKVYKKNKRPDAELKSLSCDSLNNYIKMYYSYRLKVKDAESRNYISDPAVKLELENNRKIVAESFFFDQELVNPNVEIMSERRKRELQISYMMFALPPAPSTDTTEAYNKAQKAMKRLKAGDDFAIVAREMSDDESTGKNGGKLEEYISSGKMERALEDPIYSLKVGDYYKEVISLPKFGYFIVKLDGEKAREAAKFSHILVSRRAFPDDSTGMKAITKVDSLYNLLLKGANYEEIAKANSNDDVTAKDGGRFNDWYSCSDGFATEGGKVVPEFERAIFSMKDGEISKPIQTVYGWHIIRRDSTAGMDMVAESEKMKNVYRRVYLDRDKKELLKKLQIQNGYKLNENTFRELIASVDTNKTNLDSAWTARIPNELYSSELFKYEGKTYKLSDITELMKKPGAFRGLPTNPAGFERAIQLVVEPKVINNATKNLEKDNPQFQELMDDFKNGTLLFKVESDEVWNNLKFDTTMAKEYYEANKAEFFTDKTYDIQEVMLVRKAEAEEIYNKLKNNEITFDEAAEKYTQRGGYRETKGKLKEVNPKKHKIAELVDNLGIREGEFCQPQHSENGFSIIKVNKIHQPEQLTFERAIPRIAPIIQDKMQVKRTNEWVERLKKKFKFKLYDKEINKLCK